MSGTVRENQHRIVKLYFAFRIEEQTDPVLVFGTITYLIATSSDTRSLRISRQGSGGSFFQ
jgi:hypothetical protein